MKENTFPYTFQITTSLPTSTTRDKNLTAKFSKIAKLVRKNGRKLSLARVTRQLDFCRFPAIPRPDIYFHMSLESATTIFTIFLGYINHPEEIARIVSSTFSFERWRASLLVCTIYCLTSHDPVFMTKPRIDIFLFPFIPSPSAPLSRRETTLDS